MLELKLVEQGEKKHVRATPQRGTSTHLIPENMQLDTTFMIKLKNISKSNSSNIEAKSSFLCFYVASYTF
jgi:hypothetical protein